MKWGKSPVIKSDIVKKHILTKNVIIATDFVLRKN